MGEGLRLGSENSGICCADKREEVGRGHSSLKEQEQKPRDEGSRVTPKWQECGVHGGVDSWLGSVCVGLCP